jgi:hypothetical protein
MARPARVNRLPASRTYSSSSSSSRTADMAAYSMNKHQQRHWQQLRLLERPMLWQPALLDNSTKRLPPPRRRYARQLQFFKKCKCARVQQQQAGRREAVRPRFQLHDSKSCPSAHSCLMVSWTSPSQLLYCIARNTHMATGHEPKAPWCLAGSFSASQLLGPFQPANYCPVLRRAVLCNAHLCHG